MDKKSLPKITQSEKNRLLHIMGVTYWLSRENAIKSLQSHTPIFNARCLILLPKDPTIQSKEVSVMLQGMLKVLDLRPSELAITWVGSELNLALLPSYIQQWAPATVLVMGKNLAHLLSYLKIPVFLTFHPEELQLQPENKKEAYQDLLALKKQLHDEKNT